MLWTHLFGHDGNAERPAFRHGVPRAHGEIQDRHFKLIGVDLGRRQIIRRIDDNLDLRTRRARDQVGHAMHERR